MGKVDDPVRLDSVLSLLSPGDALWLSRQLEQPWQVARRRLDARTQALRAARLVIAPGLRPRPAAEVIAVELQRYLASAWAEQQHHIDLPPGAFERHHVLHRVAVLSGGKAIGWRTVCKALGAPRHDKG